MSVDLPPSVVVNDNRINISWRGLMGRGYDWLLSFTGRYLFVAGVRGSKKSTNIARKLILDFFFERLHQHPGGEAILYYSS